MNKVIISKIYYYDYNDIAAYVVRISFRFMFDQESLHLVLLSLVKQSLKTKAEFNWFKYKR